MARKKVPIIGQTRTDIKSKFCTNAELSDLFVSDILKATGLEVDDEGYIVDTEEDPIEPTYVCIKGKPLRYVRSGILHARDINFDPYNNLMIVEALFGQYLESNHPEVLTAQVCAAKPGEAPRLDTYGFIRIIFDNGAIINTGNHWKDTTKYLEAFMRLESMTDVIIKDIMRPYDEYETDYFKNLPPEVNSTHGLLSSNRRTTKSHRVS